MNKPLQGTRTWPLPRVTGKHHWQAARWHCGERCVTLYTPFERDDGTTVPATLQTVDYSMAGDLAFAPPIDAPTQADVQRAARWMVGLEESPGGSAPQGR